MKASNDLRAGRLVRSARFSLCLAALVAVAGTIPLVPAEAAPLPSSLAHPAADQSIQEFYEARGHRPLWLPEDGSAADAANRLLNLLRSADADGLDSGRYPIALLEDAVRAAAWGGSPATVMRADRMLSEAFVAYVRDLKRAPSTGIIWVDAELKPGPPSPRRLLEEAANAPSVEQWLADMRWMNPIYAGLRNALVQGRGDPQLLRLNLERARELPSGRGRYVLVNATAQRLEMHEDGRVVDSMNVVVGKPKNPTPMMAALIRYASLNPYWYVPPDLAAERIAPNVVKEGLPYLKTHGYEVMGNWNDDSTVIDPASIDWQAVVEGRKQVWLRQLPGPRNSMGQVKFMFPNAEGVYLHDTPQKELLAEPSRMFSGGCVRLEDASRLARWLFGRPLEADGSEPERKVELPRPVPVYITYLTMVPDGIELATFPDIYGRDRQGLAQLGGPGRSGR